MYAANEVLNYNTKPQNKMLTLDLNEMPVNHETSNTVETCINHQLNAQFLYSLIKSVTLYSSACFEHRCAHRQEERKLYVYSIWYRHTL